MNIEFNFLHGVQNFLLFISKNWLNIVVIICLIVAIVKAAISFCNKSDEEKIAIVQKQIKEIILKLVTDAEIDYMEWVKAGEIKRAQVIDRIFDMYPILSTIINQEDVINWLDKIIDESLKIMRDIFTHNEEVESSNDVKTE